MTTYTTVADANGDFTVPFSSNHISGEKITVTATKDAATKTIELHAPSEVIGGAFIIFDGDATNFPNNIGGVTIAGVTGEIPSSLFSASWNKATRLSIGEGVTSIGGYAFQNWDRVASISLPLSLMTIGAHGLAGMQKLKSIELKENIVSIGDYALIALVACDEIIVRATTPPSLGTNGLLSLKSTCVIKVPSASLSAYKLAANWSVHASKMIGI